MPGKSQSMLVFLLFLAGFLLAVIAVQYALQNGLFAGPTGEIAEQNCQLALSRLEGCFNKDGSINPFGYVSMPPACENVPGYGDGESGSAACADAPGDGKVCCKIKQPQ